MHWLVTPLPEWVGILFYGWVLGLLTWPALGIWPSAFGQCVNGDMNPCSEPDMLAQPMVGSQNNGRNAGIVVFLACLVAMFLLFAALATAKFAILVFALCAGVPIGSLIGIVIAWQRGVI